MCYVLINTCEQLIKNILFSLIGLGSYPWGYCPLCTFREGGFVQWGFVLWGFVLWGFMSCVGFVRTPFPTYTKTFLLLPQLFQFYAKTKIMFEEIFNNVASCFQKIIFCHFVIVLHVYFEQI